MASDSKLFKPIHVGNLHLSHRVILAPMERLRSNIAHVPQDMMAEYYAQRASTQGSLLITEATVISPSGGGMDYTAGIWSDEQVAAWKKIVDAVHAQGSYIFMQIVHLGRMADASILGRGDCPSNPGGPYRVVAPSSAPMSGQNGNTPNELTEEDILDVIGEFRRAAHNAVHRAGFDGVEVHGAHGYLVDQFLQDMTNEREDQWGRSIENRSRFPLEVVGAVADEIGQERTAVRLSPFSTFNDMHMKHPEPTFAFFVSRLRELFPRLAYLHVTEPRVAAHDDRITSSTESNDFLRSIWKTPGSEDNGSVYISAGGYTLERALEDADRKCDLIAFGRYYTSNPDLPARLKDRIALTPYDRPSFYAVGQRKGFSDFAFGAPATEESYNARRIEA